MSDIEEQVEVRKTRSGRAVKTPVKQKAPSKAVGRKTRKRTVVMEVEVTDDEESEQVEQPEEMEPSIKKSKMSDITEETSETLENIIDTMNILPDDLIPKSEDKKPEDDEAEALKEESESLETAELVMNDVNMLGDISIDLNMDDIQEKETNGDTDDISENVIEKEDLDSIMVTQENGLEIENETETAVEDSLPVVTPEEDPLPVNPSPKEEPLPVNLSPKEEPLPVNPPLKEEPLPVNPPPKEEPLPVNPPPKEESLPVNPPKEESLPVNPPPKEESLPINPPKEESLPVNLPPKEEALPVSPSPKEEALPVSPPPKEEPLPVSPPPKEEPLPVSPSAKEEALPVSPPPKEEPLPVSPSPKEEPLPVNPPKEQPAGDPEAENISDEELPGVPVVKVPETEEVSDEELPGPKRAELPADTEVVSEDELPTSKKETEAEESTPPKDTNKRKEPEGDYDPTSPTSENESTPKKMKEDKEEKEKEGEHTKPSKPKKLPELDKYWKAVNDDPTDFTGWTFLLQYVDQENDMEAAREAYDAFLSHYPYCYGYWRKYADYEKRKGNRKKCEEVFERGLKAIPLSVDLWIHYLTYVKATRGDDEDYVRSQFERAVAACGLEFRSDRLWDSYIKWETEGKRLNRVTGIYDRLLATPTQGYPTHFDNFQEHVASNPPNKVLDVDEFMALRKEVRSSLKHDKVENVAENADVPPGDEDSKLSEEETKGIRERIVSIRRKIHKNSVAAVTARWNFEEGIKRPYFHVKPLERCHLKNWQDYLDFEIKHGDKVRIIVLFERCLIACALYEEYWLKYVHYLKTLKDPEVLSKIRDVYERACTIHHLKKPNLHMQWAIFEEANGNGSRAVEILINLEKQVPSVLLQVAYRRINLERRRSDFEKCSQLYEHYISVSKNKAISSNITIKYARFSLKILKDFNKAHEILKTAITKDPTNSRLYLQLIDLTLQKDDVKEDEICAIIDEFLEKEGADNDQKVLFAQRKLEYLEDFGSSVQQVQAAYDQYQKYLKHNKENPKKKESKSSETTSSGKKEKTTSSSSSSQPNSYGYSYGSSSGQTSYPYSGTQQGQYNYAQYGQGSDQYQYQNWQYPQGSYGSYNQWSGYGGNYSY